jgi:hypothetical protein
MRYLLSYVKWRRYFHLFFDIMVHLVIHLAKEVRIGGPIQYRSMWSVERFIGKLANMVHDKLPNSISGIVVLINYFNTEKRWR